MGIQRLNNEIPKYFASKLFQKAIIQKPYELMIVHYFFIIHKNNAEAHDFFDSSENIP